MDKSKLREALTPFYGVYKRNPDGSYVIENEEFLVCTELQTHFSNEAMDKICEGFSQLFTEEDKAYLEGKFELPFREIVFRSSPFTHVMVAFLDEVDHPTLMSMYDKYEKGDERFLAIVPENRFKSCLYQASLNLDKYVDRKNGLNYPDEIYQPFK